MNEPERALRDAFPSHQRILHLARGSLRRLRPHVVDADVLAHVNELTGNNEALLRLIRNRTEEQRLLREIRSETVTARQRAASVALFRLPEVERYVNQWRQLVASYQRDVLRSPAFNAALDKVTPDGMIALATYRVGQRERLSKVPIPEWLSTRQEALRRGDAAGLVDTEIVESLARHAVTPTKREDLDALKSLREVISWSHEERTPKDLPDFEGLAADMRRLGERANALQIGAINPVLDFTAADAFKTQEQELLTAGAASDQDDLAAVQESLATAGE